MKSQIIIYSLHHYTGHHHLKSLHQVDKSLKLTDQGKKNSRTQKKIFVLACPGHWGLVFVPDLAKLVLYYVNLNSH